MDIEKKEIFVISKKYKKGIQKIPIKRNRILVK